MTQTAIKSVPPVEQTVASSVTPRWKRALPLVGAGALGLGAIGAIIALSIVVYKVYEKQEALHGDIAALRDQVGSKMVEDIVFLKIMTRKPKVETALARDIARSIIRNAQFFGRDTDLILAIIDVESGFDPEIVSSAGAVGLMQVMPHWKPKQGITCDLKEIDCSIVNGLRIYGFYEAEFKGDIELALTAYNRGPSIIDQSIRSGFDPRNGYAKKIRESYAYFKSLNAGVSQ